MTPRIDFFAFGHRKVWAGRKIDPGANQKGGIEVKKDKKPGSKPGSEFWDKRILAKIQKLVWIYVAKMRKEESKEGIMEEWE